MSGRAWWTPGERWPTYCHRVGLLLVRDVVAELDEELVGVRKHFGARVHARLGGELLHVGDVLAVAPLLVEELGVAAQLAAPAEAHGPGDVGVRRDGVGLLVHLEFRGAWREG